MDRAKHQLHILFFSHVFSQKALAHVPARPPNTLKLTYTKDEGKRQEEQEEATPAPTPTQNSQLQNMAPPQTNTDITTTTNNSNHEQEIAASPPPPAMAEIRSTATIEMATTTGAFDVPPPTGLAPASPGPASRPMDVAEAVVAPGEGEGSNDQNVSGAVAAAATEEIAATARGLIIAPPPNGQAPASPEELRTAEAEGVRDANGNGHGDEADESDDSMGSLLSERAGAVDEEGRGGGEVVKALTLTERRQEIERQRLHQEVVWAVRAGAGGGACPDGIH